MRLSGISSPCRHSRPRHLAPCKNPVLQLFRSPPDMTLDARAFDALLQRHRSIRQFKPDDIPPAELQAILASAIQGTSSSGNLNTFSVIVTRDPARRQALHELHMRQDMILQSPVLLTFCADTRRVRDWLALNGARDNFDHLHGFLVAAFDAMMDSDHPAFAATGVRCAGLDEVLTMSDVVSLHVPLVESTRGLLGAARLEIGRRCGLIDESQWAFVWVVDAPLFEPASDAVASGDVAVGAGAWTAVHHAFTSPQDVENFDADPGNALAWASSGGQGFRVRASPPHLLLRLHLRWPGVRRSSRASTRAPRRTCRRRSRGGPTRTRRPGTSRRPAARTRGR